MKKVINFYIPVLVISSACITSCTKFVSVDPPYTSTNTEQVYAKDATATAALTAIYIQMSQADVTPNNGITSIAIDCGLYTDELNYIANSPSEINRDLWSNQLTPTNNVTTEWTDIYKKIFETNAAIENLNNSNALTPAVKQQLLGEAKFLRGFLYFYLTNLFGDVPLAVSTDYKVNSLLSRTPQDQVYHQIIEDLVVSDSLLSPAYRGGDALSATSERVRPSQAAAEAMLARVYLYQKDYPKAENYATKVISNTGLYSLVALDSVFLKNSPGTIWSIPSVKTNRSANTPEGRIFVVNQTTNQFGPPYNLTNSFLNAFEAGDQRATHWIISGVSPNGGISYVEPYKYKIGSDLVSTAEYSIVLRLAELYLIRAEARAMQNNVPGAQDDLNAIRHRAGLGDTPAATQDALITAILHERQVELFTEWGNRFFDLKRLGKLDAVLGAEKPGWNTDDQYFPIPQQERDRDPNLTQNPGYN